MNPNALIPLIYVNLLIVMGPALVVLVPILQRLRRENLRDRRLLAEQKLARLGDLVSPANQPKAA